MISHVLSQGPVGWCSLVLLLCIYAGQSSGQVLSADGTGQVTTMFVVFFRNGTNTVDIGTATLPTCTVSNGPTTVILEKVDGSLEIGRAAVAGMFGGYVFNTTTHPVLTAVHSGLYRCRAVRTGTDTFSPRSYQLNVVDPVTLSASESPSVTYNTTSATQVFTCNATGNQAINVTWSSSVGLTSNIQQMPTPTPSLTSGTVSSTFSFAGNDSAIISLGIPFNVSCSAHYQGVTCTNGTVPSVRADCIDALQAQYTTTVTALATECPRIIDLRSNTNATSSTPNTVRSVVNLGCMQGYNLTASFLSSTHDILEVTCLITGEWNRLPFCNITHCPPLSDAGVDSPIPGLEVGENASIGCMNNYQILLSTVMCQADGNWTAGPYCDFDACKAGQHNCKPTSNCTYSTGSFTCNCSDGACSYTDCPMISGPAIEDVPQTLVTPLMPTNHTVVCKTGYEKPVPANISCQQDGTWSNASPNCSVKVPGSSGSNVGAIVGGVVGGVVGAIIVICVVVYLKKKGNCAKSVTDGGKGGRPVPTAEDGVVPAIDEHELAALRQPRVDTRGPPPPDSDPTNTFEPGQRIPIGDHSRLLNDPRGGTGSNGDEGHYDAFVRDNQAAPQPAPPVDDSATYDHIVRPVNPDSGALPPMGPNSSYEQIRLPGEPAQQPAPNNPSPGADAAAEAAEPQPPDAQYSMVDLSKKSRR